MKHSNAFLIMYGVNFTKSIENAKPHSHPTLLENHYFNFLCYYFWSISFFKIFAKPNKIYYHEKIIITI